VVTLLQLEAADYHADLIDDDRPSLSTSIVKTLVTQSPLHAKTQHPRLNPDLVREEDPKFDLGTCVHSLFLEGVDNIMVIPFDDWRKAAAKEQRDEARAHGFTPLLPKQADEARAMVKAIHQQLDRFDVAPPLFTDGQPEQTLVWEEDGVLCRARPDWLRDDLTAIDDMKTTRASANPDRWDNTMFGMAADIQVAWYLRGLTAHTGQVYEPSAFRFFVVEAYPPFACSAVTLAPDSFLLANRKIDYALGVWRRCLQSDSWPSYPARLAHIEAPGWAESAWLERELREAVA
jgi:hypothetical protein